MIFGGASVKDRMIKLAVDLTIDSGIVTIRIRLGSKVEEHTFDKNSNFEKELEFNSGRNYIMLDYEHFKGKVKLFTEYT